MRITKSDCKMCGMRYTHLMSGRWPRGTADTRQRSSTLCPDCHEVVMSKLVAWSQERSQSDWCFFLRRLVTEKRLPIQAALAVTEILDETCPYCFGKRPCNCMRDD